MLTLIKLSLEAFIPKSNIFRKGKNPNATTPKIDRCRDCTIINIYSRKITNFVYKARRIESIGIVKNFVSSKVQSIWGIFIKMEISK